MVKGIHNFENRPVFLSPNVFLRPCLGRYFKIFIRTPGGYARVRHGKMADRLSGLY